MPNRYIHKHYCQDKHNFFSLTIRVRREGVHFEHFMLQSKLALSGREEDVEANWDKVTKLTGFWKAALKKDLEFESL